MAAQTDAAGRRVKKKGEPPLAPYVDKDATKLQKEMTVWLKEQTGYDADEKTVALTMALRMKFQSSEANQKNLNARRQEIESERAAREQKRADRAAGKKATPAEPAKPRRRRPKPAEAEGATPEAAPAA